MKWTFLKRRSRVQELGTQASGRTEFVNVVEEEASQDSSSRDSTGSAFEDANDRAQQPLTSSSEPFDAGAQPPLPLETSAHIETTRPENPDHTILLQAADALELVEAHIEKWMDALRYFVDLGSSDRSRDFADVKRNLANTYTLINSSDLILLRVRELAGRFRALATEEATRRASIPHPNERPGFPVGPTPPQKGPDEQTRMGVALSKIEAPLEESSTDSQPVDPSPPQREPDEQKRVDMGLSEVEVAHEEPSTYGQPPDPFPTQEEQDEQPVGVVLSEVEVPLEKPSTDSKLLDPGLIQEEQHEQRVDTVLSEVEAPLEKPSTDSQPTPAQKEQDEQERIGVMLSEVDVSPEDEEPTADSPPLDAGSSQKEQDEQKRIDMVLSEIEALFREASTDRQPAPQVNPGSTQEVPVTAHPVQDKRNQSKMSDLVSQEIETLLGKDVR
jgi:hypothetical protein